jgi:drug/metabolite transporter (DMT)-like permease
MLAGLCLARRWPRLRPREWLTVALVGTAGTAGFHLGLVGGLALTTPAHAALLVNLSWGSAWGCGGWGACCWPWAA